MTAGDIKKTIIVTQKQKDAITFSTDRVEVDKNGGNIDIEVKANIDYSVEIPDYCSDWISQAGSTRGMNRKKLSFKISESEEYDKREGEIIFTSDKVTEIIKVYQTGSAIIILSQNEYTLGSEGGSVSVEISSNFNFNIDMPKVDWVKMSNSTRALSSHTLKFDVGPNSTYDDREAVIVIKDANSDRKESVTIKQKQKDAIVLSSDRQEVAQEGGLFSVEVNSNVAYTVEIPESSSNWIRKAEAPASANGTRALEKTTPYFRAESNFEQTKREGEIHFKHGDITEVVKIYQSGGSVIVLSQDTYNLSGGVQTIDIDLKSNIDYSSSVDCDWITEVSTRAVSSSTKHYNIAANKSGKNRSGKITYKSSDGKKTATVTVNQATLIEAKTMSLDFENTSGIIGGNLYIGKNYGFTVNVTPLNAETNLEWKVEDSSIASISSNGNSATLTTRNYGKTKVIVTEKNSGLSKSYDFGTAVTDFRFTENTGETGYGYPTITMVVGEKYQLHYSCNPSYATRIFRDLKPFNFKEILPGLNVYAIVDKSTVVDIDENGVMTALKVGTTIINANNGYGVCKAGSNDGIYVKVIRECEESEYNNDFSTANMIKDGQPMKFRLSSMSDIDVFKFNVTSSPYMYLNIEGLESLNYQNYSKLLRYEIYDSSYKLTGSGTISLKGTGEVYNPMPRYVGRGEIAYVRFYYEGTNYYNFHDGYIKVSLTPFEE